MVVPAHGLFFNKIFYWTTEVRYGICEIMAGPIDTHSFSEESIHADTPQAVQSTDWVQRAVLSTVEEEAGTADLSSKVSIHPQKAQTLANQIFIRFFPSKQPTECQHFIDKLASSLLTIDRSNIEEKVYTQLAHQFIENEAEHLSQIADKRLYHTIIRELALTCDISKNIQQYRITDQAMLIEIAKLAAQHNARDVSEYIENYGITSEDALIEIATLAAQHNALRVSQHIENYRITSEAALIKIATLAAQRDGLGVSQHIKNYGITSEDALIEIAKLVAQKNGWGVSQHIKNYGITSEDALIEIATLAAKQNAGGVSQHIKNYGITSEDALIEIATLAAKQGSSNISQHIKNYGITSEDALIEIATLAAQHNARDVSEYIKNYKIKDQAALIEIAKLAGRDNPLSVLENIDNYKIDNLEALWEVTALCRFSTAKQIHTKIKLDDLPDAIKRLEQDKFCSRIIQAMDKKIAAVKDPLQREILNTQKLRKIILLDYALFTIKDLGAEIREKVNLALEKIVGYRNVSVACSLMEVFCKDVVPRALGHYLTLSDKQHLILPMIFITALARKSGIPSIKLKKFLLSERSDLRDTASKKMPILLNALSALLMEPHLNADQKLALLENAVSAKPEEVYDRLDLIQVLCTFEQGQRLVNPFALTEELSERVVACVKETEMLDLEGIQDFPQNYANTFGKSRVPNAFFIYLSRLSTLKDPSLTPALTRFVKGVLTGTYEQDRLTENPHLQAIAKVKPGLLQLWNQEIPPTHLYPEEETAARDIVVVATHNWEDILLSGTDVEGSCQSIHSDPESSKCLLGYMDAKSEMLAVKDEDGKILARCFLKLLLDNTGQPVLFQEKIYPTPCDPRMTQALDKLAKERARQLDCPLAVKDIRPDLGSRLELESLGNGYAPYEYEDGVDDVFKVTNGIYRITAHRVLT